MSLPPHKDVLVGQSQQADPHSNNPPSPLAVEITFIPDAVKEGIGPGADLPPIPSFLEIQFIPDRCKEGMVMESDVPPIPLPSGTFGQAGQASPNVDVPPSPLALEITFIPDRIKESIDPGADLPPIPSSLDIQFIPGMHKEDNAAEPDVAHMPLSPETLLKFIPDGLKESTVPEESDDEGGVNAKGRGKRQRDTKETFIIVRPPPHKSNHPMNLQVQLVPPISHAARERRLAYESLSPSDTAISIPNHQSFQRDQDQVQGARSGLASSDRWDARSSATLVNSVISSATTLVNSTATTTSRRVLIPLYNLQATENRVLDAGTDAKVARFLQRGLEVINLATLEPIEVWRFPSLPTSSYETTTVGMATSGSEYRQSVEMGDVEGALSAGTGSSNSRISHAAGSPTVTLEVRPTSPAPPFSVSSAGWRSSSSIEGDPRDSITTPSKAVAAYPTGGIARIFSKFFRRKVAISLPSATSSTLAAASVDSLPASLGERAGSAPILGPPVLGTQPKILLPRGYTGPMPVRGSGSDGGGDTGAGGAGSTGGRPTAYIWVMRKWQKYPEAKSLLAEIVGRFGGGSDGDGDGDASGRLLLDASVEVNFEWKRKKSGGGEKGGKRRKKRMQSSIKHEWVSSAALNEDDDGAAHEDVQRNKWAPRNTSDRPSTSLGEPEQSQSSSGPIRQAKSPSTAPVGQSGIGIAFTSSEGEHYRDKDRDGDLGGRGREDEADDSGEESDPEDSETPWACTLNIRRFPPPGTSVVEGDDGGGGADDIKLKVGTLSPTPHHPKVVALLKIPYPLPDIELNNAVVWPRTAKMPGMEASKANADRRLMLTAEEIKDVIATTSMWLVVKERMGGIGTVSRKGYGWRIRGRA